MRILLVQPPYLAGSSRNAFVVSQPMGLAYLAAVARNSGHDVRIMDMVVHDQQPEAVNAVLEEFRPDLVGISSPFSIVFPSVLQIAKHVKRFDKSVKVIVGGSHPSSSPGETLENEVLDFVVIGEGEQTFSEFLAGKPYSELDGFGYRENGQVIVNPKRGFIKNLDDLPFPARDLLDLEAYWRPDLLKVRGIAGRHWTPLSTSRGCPQRCNFCSVYTVWQRRWRQRSPENVVAEIDDVVKRFGIDAFNIEDDSFTLDMNRAKAILRLIRERDLKLEFRTPNGVRADRLDRELLQLMKDTGFVTVSLGIESGDQNVNSKIIHKNLNLKSVEHAVREGSRVGVPVRGFFMLGLPGERIFNMLRTVGFAVKLTLLGMHDAAFFITTPYVGTPLYDVVIERGYLTIPESDLNLARADRGVIRTEHFSPWQVELIQAFAYTVTNLLARRPRTAYGHLKRYVRHILFDRGKSLPTGQLPPARLS